MRTSAFCFETDGHQHPMWYHAVSCHLELEFCWVLYSSRGFRPSLRGWHSFRLSIEDFLEFAEEVMRSCQVTTHHNVASNIWMPSEVILFFFNVLKDIISNRYSGSHLETSLLPLHRLRQGNHCDFHAIQTCILYFRLHQIKHQTKKEKPKQKTETKRASVASYNNIMA